MAFASSVRWTRCCRSTSVMTGLPDLTLPRMKEHTVPSPNMPCQVTAYPWGCWPPASLEPQDPSASNQVSVSNPALIKQTMYRIAATAAARFVL